MPSLSYTPFYAAGDITLTNGSTTFSLAVGALVTNARPGDHVIVDGAAAIGVIESITNETEGELVFAWAGSTVTTGDYKIQHTGPFWHTTAEAVTRANELLKRVVAGGNLWETTGQPTADVGYEGDYAIDVQGNTAILYAKDGSGWDAGTILVGNSVRVGTGAPDNGTGEDNDLYIRTSNGQVYEKVAGSWTEFAVLTGATGPKGDPPAPMWTFSTATTDADPGNGNVRFNNAAIESVTQIFIDLVLAGGGAYTAVLDGWDDAGAAGNRGVLHVFDKDDVGKWATFRLTGSVISAIGYRKLTVTRIASSPATGAPFASGAELAFVFTPIGAKGDTGAPGTSPGVRMLFEASLTGDPGNGALRLDNASIGSVTEVAIDDLDLAGADIEPWIQSLDDVANTVSRGTLVVTNPADNSSFRLAITSVAADQTGYWTFSVEPLGGTIPADGTAILVSFIASGNDGADGADGSDGADGTDGAQGIPGPASTPMAVIYRMGLETADADPGNGKVRFNNADWSLATEAYLDDLSYSGVNVSSWLAGWDDRGTSDLRGILLAMDVEDPSKFLIADVVGTVIDGGGYSKVTIDVVAAGDTPDDIDPNGNDAYTKVLLRMDGTDASTTFTDSAAGATANHTWTASGNAQIDTAESKFGGASGVFDGTGDYVSTPDHDDFSLGSGDWTIDCWFRCEAPSGSQRFLATHADGSLTEATIAFALYRLSSNVMTIRLSNGTSSVYATGTTQFTDSLNTGWHHLSVTRSGNTVRMFIDGTLEATSVFTGAVNDSAQPLTIGALATGGQGWLGWLDEFRLSIDIARWTDDFTPPSEPYIPFLTSQLGVHFVPGVASTVPARLGEAGQAVVTDWDGAIENGWYYGDDAANAPDAGEWIVEVRRNGDATTVVQRAILASNPDTAFQRTRDAGVWADWVANAGDIATRTYVNARVPVTPQDYDAAADATGSGLGTDDAAAIQDAIDAAIDERRELIFAGAYRVGSGLTVDVSAVASSTDARLSLRGERGGTVLYFDTGDFDGLSWIGSTGHALHAMMHIAGINFNKTDLLGKAIKLTDAAFFTIEGVYCSGWDFGLYMEDCLSAELAGSQFRFNNYGIHAQRNNGSRPNAISLLAVILGNNQENGIVLHNPANVNMFGGSIEGNGSLGDDATKGGMYVLGGPTGGGCGVLLDGVYIENNVGIADVLISSSAGIHGAYAFNNCSFQRISSTAPVTNHVRATGTDRMALSFFGNGFKRLGTYGASASRKYVDVSGAPNAVLNLGASNFQHDPIESVPITDRIKLTANLSLYVKPSTGSDTWGSGSASAPFATISRGLEEVHRFDLAGHLLYIEIENGTYAEAISLPPLVGGDGVLRGNTGSPSSVLIQPGSAGNVIQANGLPNKWTIDGVKVAQPASGSLVVASRGSVLDLSNINFGPIGAGVSYQVHAYDAGSIITFNTNYTISGGGPRCHMRAEAGASITCNNRTITLSGTPGFGAGSNAFAVASANGTIWAQGNTYSGAATGTRYYTLAGGVIHTSGGGASYFPGNVAGGGDGSGVYT